MTRLKESLTLFGLLFRPSRHRSVSVYTLLGEHNNLGDTTRYINLGYWKNATSYDEACTALVDLVGKKATLENTHQVLDVGCGFGEQDLRWVETHNPTHIDAVNITPLHIDYAKTHHKHPQVSFTLASATDLPFQKNSFDRVLGLESAFHFDTRRDFFREAMRVLKPGGKMVLADTVPTQSPQSLRDYLKFWAVGGLWQVPLTNYYDAKTYAHYLKQAGFIDIQIEDISAHVWRPFKRFAQQRVQHPEIKERVHPALRKIWGTPHKTTDLFQYIIVSARKPNSND